MSTDELIAEALEARKNAYAKYSGFAVGAALLTASGLIFRGCNVENISFGLTICAERVAIGAAVQAGETKFVRIVIAAAAESPVVPCGACRQVLAEFNPSIVITMVNLEGKVDESSLSFLLPLSHQGILG